MFKLVLAICILSQLYYVKCSICKNENDLSEPCFDTKSFNYDINQKVQMEKSIELECYVKNKGSFYVMWYDDNGIVSLNSQVIKPDPNIQIDTDSEYKFNLRINNVNANNKGSYKCQISTLKASNLDYNLDVLIPPSITRMPNTDVITLNEGDSLTVQCLTQGNPMPVLTWSKKGEKAVHTTIDESRSALSLENVNESHSDSYSCTAKNDVGNPVTSEFVILVKFKPRITIKKEENIEENVLYTAVDKKERITCLVDSYPVPKMSLLHNDVEILPSTYTFESVNFSDKQYALVYSFTSTSETIGVYTCIAENDMGISSSQLRVTPTAANIKISNVDLPIWSDAFVFQWSLFSGSQIQELNVQVFSENNETDPNNETNLFTKTRHIQSDGTHSQVTYHNENILYKDYYEITKLMANSTYHVRIRVKNDFSSEWSEFSSNLTVKTLADKSQKHKPHQIHHHRHNHGRKVKGYSQQTGSRDLNAKRDRFINYESNLAMGTAKFYSSKFFILFSIITVLLF